MNDNLVFTHEVAVRLGEATVEAIFEGELPKRFACIQGPPGIGKSQMLHAFARLVQEHGGSVSWLSGTSLEPDVVQLEQVRQCAPV